MTADEARAILAGQFPALTLASVEGPSSGTSNDCFLVDGEWIFRFPKSAESAAELARELLLLPAMARDLALPVPEYLFLGRAAEGCAHPFVGYRRIPGEELTRARLESLPDDRQDEVARRLGAFLTRLHDMPLDRLRQAEAATGVAMVRSPIEWFTGGGRDFRSTLSDKLAENRGHPDYPLFRRLVETLLDDPEIYAPEETLVHGDLGRRHILYCDERGTVTGVIDFGNLALGDPFADFSQLARVYGLAFAHRILDHYARPSGPLLKRKLAKGKFVLDNLRAFRRLMGLPESSSS